MRRYSDLVVWLPEPHAELAAVVEKPVAAPLAPVARWRPQFLRRSGEVKAPQR
jgi:hypothetical protein